jgi:galactokinase
LRRISAWRAPGRVNLIGEHTDYNGGFVLPFAIEVGCTATVHARADDVIELRSAQLAAPAPVPRAELRPGAHGWAGYPLGVVWALRSRGFEVPGLTIAVDSDVPVGSGLSSSAALVCSVATAVNDLLELELPPAELLAITRSAENDYVGAPTGGMDQLAALHCTAGRALFCDMRSLEFQQVPLVLGEFAILVVDTRAEHRHADGEYRRRRAGCEAAARQLGVPTLRDVDDLAAALRRLGDEELRRYTRHVVTENARVLRTVAALRAGDLAAVGPLLTESHVSMRDDFQITGPELDLAAESLLEAGALGARLTGGGFGGCVIALVGPTEVHAAASAVRSAFATARFADPRPFVVHPSAGAHRVA